ncbi:hypothetical protein ACI2K4_15180 [Micromonospora sp. NPDC050397]
MELFILLFVLLLTVASASGLTADSRDSLGGQPGDGSRDWRSRTC